MWTRLKNRVRRFIASSVPHVAPVSAGTQRLLLAEWRRQPPEWADAEFRVYSQTGEDGLLLAIFARIGFTNRVVVEIGCGNGVECNAANLLIHHGCTGLLIDGDPENVAWAQHFYAEHPDTRNWPPVVRHAFVMRENVNAMISDAGITGDIDLLSLDIDGMDWWVLDALTVIRPRVIILECNNLWDAETAVTVPYRANFAAELTTAGVEYGGASLLAFARLARRKGYTLAGANRYGYNAIFVRAGLLPEVAVASCLTHPQAVHARTVRHARIAHLPVVHVGEDGHAQ